MFDKLKLKLIALNMAMLITVFVSIFGSIFIITNNNIKREINANLNSLIYKTKMPMPHTVNIVVEVDSNGRIKSQFRSYEASTTNDNLQDVVSSILNSNKLSGKVKIDDSNYSYLIGNGVFGTKIAFMDISLYDTILLQLIKSLVGIGFVSLIVLLIISIYLTNKSIAPVKEVFEKQKQFIADASHELKTPLAIIKTNTSLILINPFRLILYSIFWIT